MRNMALALFGKNNGFKPHAVDSSATLDLDGPDEQRPQPAAMRYPQTDDDLDMMLRKPYRPRDNPESPVRKLPYKPDEHPAQSQVQLLPYRPEDYPTLPQEQLLPYRPGAYPPSTGEDGFFRSLLTGMISPERILFISSLRDLPLKPKPGVFYELDNDFEKAMIRHYNQRWIDAHGGPGNYDPYVDDDELSGLLQALPECLQKRDNGEGDDAKAHLQDTYHDYSKRKIEKESIILLSDNEINKRQIKNEQKEENNIKNDDGEEPSDTDNRSLFDKALAKYSPLVFGNEQERIKAREIANKVMRKEVKDLVGGYVTMNTISPIPTSLGEAVNKALNYIFGLPEYSKKIKEGYEKFEQREKERNKNEE